MQVTRNWLISREEIVKDEGEDKSVDIEIILREEWGQIRKFKIQTT